MQFAAAAAAAALLRWLYSRDARRLAHLGAPGLTSGVSVWQGLVIEMVLTFFLVWVVFATAPILVAPQVDSRVGDRADHHGRRLDGRPDDGRRDESGPCLRA